MRPRALASKIVSREEAVRRIAALGSRRVVVANGLFDIVHVGHARYLADARCQGDLLVVALNDDASARAIKGAERPYVPLAERAQVIAAFRSVDLVTSFPERSVAETLTRLRPRFHAKGTDYTPTSLPAEERALHERLGIEVVIVGDPKDHATTQIVGEVRRRGRGGTEVS